MLQFAPFEPTNEDAIMQQAFAQQYPMVPFSTLIPQTHTIRLDDGCVYFRRGTTVYSYNRLTHTWKTQPSSFLGRMFTQLFGPSQQDEKETLPVAK